MSTFAWITGSGWDAWPPGPEALAEKHLAEWLASGIAPELAAANLQTLAGPAVLEALLGERLEQLGGDASQYVTGRARRLLEKLEPLADAGGWWCSGLDPATGWSTPQSWGCFKGDAPRWDPSRDRWLKYEHPTGVATRLFWLAVPAVVAQRVAERFEVELPPEVAADVDGSTGAFWRWWQQDRRLPLIVTEGAKKAAALLSIGVPAVALPGIWSAGGVLPPDLAAMPLAGRACWGVFDHSDRPNPAEPKAAHRLGRLLQAAAAIDVRVGTVPGTHGKGADDHLAAGGSWEALAAALAPPRLLPALPRLRRPDVVAPAGQHLGETVSIPSGRKVVALAAPMGAGKTELIAAHLEPLQAAGARVVLITHRRSLGEALAQRLGLPWADEAAPGCDLRQTGIALCVDSLHAGSRLRFLPAEWKDAIVVIDEVTAVLAHGVMGTGTAIKDRRVPVLQSLAALLAGARQVLIADAQLDSATLGVIEAAAGDGAFLIGSDHRPAAGRELVLYGKRAGWYDALTDALQRRQRVWISTTAAEADTPNSACNIAALVRRYWPDCRVLVVDRDTVADPADDAHRLASDPDGIAAAHDVVIATPAVAAGLSVTLLDHFAAVFVSAGGTTDPGAVAQAAGRVRDGCPRHLYAPDRSPGDRLRVGCGSICPDQLMLHLSHHHHVVVGQLAAAGMNLSAGTTGPWLPFWAQLAAQQNRARLTFLATVAGLLTREGYRARQATEKRDAICPKMLRELAKAEHEAAHDRVLEAPVLTDEEARKLENRRGRLSPAERAQLQRWRVDRTWNLQGAAPSHALLEAHDDGAHRRVVFRWAVTDPAAAPLVAAHDRQQARQQAPDGRAWAPDLTRTTMAAKVAVAQALGLGSWLERTDSFSADDPALLELVARVSKSPPAIVQTLGVSVIGGLALKPGARQTTVLRQLLTLVGARLESRRVRSGPGRGSARQYHYRVVVDPLAWRPAKDGPPLTDRVTPDRVVAAWCAQLGAGGVPKNPLQKGMGGFGTPEREAAAC